MYNNYWLTLKGTLYAALRIKKQLIARPGQRVGVDSFGAQYNIDRGNQTLVLQREAEMHSEMDKRGLRWQKDKKNELFAPRKSVKELIDAMRTIRGEDMYLFDSETIREDTTLLCMMTDRPKWNRWRWHMSEPYLSTQGCCGTIALLLYHHIIL